MKIELKNAQELINFIYDSPSAFHAVNSVKKILINNGFKELHEEQHWNLAKGKKYFMSKNQSAITAFIVGNGDIEENGFKIIGAHTDSPTFRIKPNAEIVSEGAYVKLNTEVYGGPILNTWMDRPLSVAGRVAIRSENPMKPITKLLNIKRPILIIPNLAIHMNRDVNQGVALNRQSDMLPVISLVNDQLEKGNYLVSEIAKELNVNIKDIIDFDLFLYEFEKGCICGLNNEFISSGRLDDLTMVHAGLKAMVEAKQGLSTNVLVCFDNEEVGSSTKQGANSPMLSSILERIVLNLGKGREEYFRSLANSFIISCDSAHAVHPNRGEKADPVNRPMINKGPVIKVSASQSYTSDSVSSAIYEEICKNAQVPVQRFVNRSDERGGSTIGPINSAHVNIKSVDMGTALLAMHSIRETGGVKDHSYTIESFKEFYNL
ncbi:MAG: family aminopeptidase [Clostridiaceae bacterium]|jgi:aspartyl aminopeptidase|nr:family aminopeptidase [Clostridiaceae bacterium]